MCAIENSHPEVFLGKGILKIWSKFTGELMLNCDFNKVAYLQENTHAEVWFHSLLFHKLHFGMGVLL